MMFKVELGWNTKVEFATFKEEAGTSRPLENEMRLQPRKPHPPILIVVGRIELC